MLEAVALVEPSPEFVEVRASAEELFRRHALFVRRFVIRLGARQEDVDDVVQDVFLVAHRRGGYMPGPARPTTWLAEIALRTVMALRRSRARAPTADAAIEEARSDGPTPYDSAAASTTLSLLARALDSLDYEHRAVFVLYELEDESCESIAQSLDVPIGTVYSRLHHARRALRIAYERQNKRGTVAAIEGPR